MQYAAFFRNLNLGRPNCPTRAQFEAAFREAGARQAESFLTNGTLVFTPEEGLRARKLLAEACRRLHLACGLREPAFVRSVESLAELVARRPFARVAPGSVYACCVTFVRPDFAQPPRLPLATPHGDVQVLACTHGEALSVSRLRGRTPGSPNAFFEKLLGAPATTRNWNTVERLVARFG